MQEKKPTKINQGAFYNTLQLSSPCTSGDGCSQSWQAVTSTITACMPLWRLRGDAEGDHAAHFWCVSWASSWTHCSSDLQHHHVTLRFLDFRISSCKGTAPWAQFCLLMGESQRKPQLPEQVRETQRLESGHLRWIMHKASPRSLRLSTDFWPLGDPRNGSCPLMLAETNFLHSGKLRRIRLYMGRCYLESNKRLMTSGWSLPAAGTCPVRCWGSAPHHHGHSPSAQHPAPTMQRWLKLTVPSLLLQEAFTRPEHLLPALALLPLLLALLVSRISAVSATSQQHQQRNWWLYLTAPTTQTCLLPAGTVSLAPGLHLTSCVQMWEGDVHFIIFFPSSLLLLWETLPVPTLIPY